MTRQRRTLRISSRNKWLLGIGTIIATLLMLYFASPLFWLGRSTLSILTGATRVQTFEIDPLIRSENGPLNSWVGGHRVLKVGRDLAGPDAAVLAQILIAPQNYHISPLVGAFVSCAVTPGVAFRFWRGRESVDVLACYFCYHIVVYTHNAQGKTTHTFVSSFPVNELSGFVRKGFPDDPLLQKSIQDYEEHRMESE